MQLSRLVRLLLCFSILFILSLTSNYRKYAAPNVQFWYIEDIQEQLGKAKFHFLEQVFIADQLRRVVVLPNVGQSQIGMRHPYAFDFYYQTEPLSNIFLTEPALSFRSHLSNLKKEKKTITAVLLYILLEHQCSKHHLTWSEVQSKLWLELQATFDIILSAHPVCFETKYGSQAPSYPQPIIEFLRRNHSSADIIVTIKNSYLFVMDPPVLPMHLLKHNRSLIEIAEVFARRYQPYIAVHWRMEGAQGNGTECGQILVNATRRYIPSYKVYFATDHPFNKELKSASFQGCCRKDFTEGYHTVLNSIRPITLNNLPLGLIGSDSGSQSIVEKLICEKSDVFLAGNVPCDRHGSYGREMIKFRHLVARTPWLYWNLPNETYQPLKAYPW